VLIPEKRWLYEFYRDSSIDEDFSSVGQQLRMRRVAEAVRAFIPPGALVADIGCGDGTGSGAVLGDLPILFIGVDYAAEKLSRLSKHVPSVKGRLVADAEVLPLATASVDLLLCMETIEHVPSPATALREFHRVLRPDGHVIMTVPLSSAIQEPLIRLYHWLQRKPEAFTPHLHFFTIRGARRLARAAGFRVALCRPHAFNLLRVGLYDFARSERLDRAFGWLRLGLTGKPDFWTVGHTFVLLVLAKA
jgi:ubiquinone/menaquinone biosynthesis C-methylase UbiE